MILPGLPRATHPLPPTLAPYALLGTGTRTITHWPVQGPLLSPGAPRYFIHGDARGADRLLAGIFAARGCEPVPVPAAWSELPDSAGHVRNGEMLRRLLEQPGPHAVLALWDRHSPGTRNMLCRAMAAGVPCFVVVCG